MKAATIKKNWETKIRKSIEKTNNYHEKAIIFLNNQSDSFCEEYKNKDGLTMLIKLQSGNISGFVDDGCL